MGRAVDALDLGLSSSVEHAKEGFPMRGVGAIDRPRHRVRSRAMTPALRPRVDIRAFGARGSGRGADATVDASTEVVSAKDGSSATAGGGRGTDEDGDARARGIGSAVTHAYDRATMLAMRTSMGASELPVELSASTIECVLNDANEAVARAEGSVWGKGHKDPGKEKEKAVMQETETVAAVSERPATAAPGQSVGPLDVDKSKRVARAACNKLSDDKVERAVAQLKDCAMNEIEVAKTLASAIVDRCVSDERAANACAELCVKANALAPNAYLINNGASSASFKSLFLSALQDDFEAAELARQTLAKSVADRFEREAAAKKLKTRACGAARTVGALYVRGFVGEGVVRAIADELIGESGTTPSEDYVDAMCGLLETCGAVLDKNMKKVVDAYVARLNVWGESDELNALVRFACRDVIESRLTGWKSKKTASADDSKKSSHSVADALANATPAVSDEILFPEGPKSTSASFAPLRGPYAAPAGTTTFPTAANRAALEAKLRSDAKARAEAKAEAAAAAASGAVPSSSNYSAEQADQKIASFVDEYCQVGDVSEALLCVSDVIKRTSDEEATKMNVARALVDRVVNESTVKTADLVAKLLAALFTDGGFDTSTLEQAIGDVVSVLDDIAIDCPMAPKLLSKVVASVVAAGAVALDFITAAGSGIEDVTVRRDFAGAALVELRAAKFAGLVAGALEIKEFASTTDDGVDTVTEWLEKLNLRDLVA